VKNYAREGWLVFLMEKIEEFFTIFDGILKV